MKALVVDDEKLIVKGLRFSLMQDGYEVDAAYDGEEAVDAARRNDYDVILLDVMLPKLNGFEVLQAVREFSDVPIIMLTAKGDDMDKILGLESGADDYITKPFNILEVRARIKAIRRRDRMHAAAHSDDEARITAGDFTLDKNSRRVYISGKEVRLTAKEFNILELMAGNPDKVYNREKLLKCLSTGKVHETVDERTVDVHVRRLREKLEEVSDEKKYIHTKWGVGYYFSEEGD